MTVSLSPAAAEDIEEIGDHIHKDNPRAALAFVRALRDRCERIADVPEGGRPRNELRTGLRSIAFRTYVIFYTVAAADVRVERVMHGRRDIEAIFAEDAER